MTPKVVSFDCAQTILDVGWRVDTFARSCCESVGVSLPDEAFGRYRDLYLGRMPEFLDINRTRDPGLGAEWWLRLTRDWLAAEGLAAELAPELAEASRRLGFSEGSILFRLYADVVPCLDRLKSLGIRTAVLSNWDYSLHQALAIFDLNARFECVLASLEEGCEKPQAEFFGLLVSRLGVEPFEVLHVGDDPVADVWGAREAGLRAVLIDRNATDVLAPDVISTLDRLEETRAWNG